MQQSTPREALTIRDVLRRDPRRLAQTLGLDATGALIEVLALLSRATGSSRAMLSAHGERALTSSQASEYESLISRRLTGMPVAYLLGEREFYGLRLVVTPSVLIPRPETETLVERALEHIGEDEQARVLDLGTGSGAVALAIAHARPAARVTAVECSVHAVAVAGSNAVALGLENVEIRQGDWYAPVGGQRFRVIVANPPYLADDDPHLALGALPFEPRQALVSGPNGVECIRRIVAGAAEHLEPGGWLLFEHGSTQGQVSRRLLRQHGFQSVATWADLAGLERVSGGRRPPSI